MKPMLFHEAPVADVPRYAQDPDWYFQQKIDGIRGQLIVEPGRAPYFLSRSGRPLVSSTAAKITTPLLRKFGRPTAGPSYMVDGELLNGKWYVFDIVVGDDVRVPYATRADRVEAWVATLDLPMVEALPLARTTEEKIALFAAIKNGGGEGVMMKRTDSPYSAGARVTHSLKAKITSTADLVVMALNRNGKENAILGAFDGREFREIGSASMIGKIKRLGKIEVGTLVEVTYLYSDRDHSLVQPRIVRVRNDKGPRDATTAQLRRVNKDVLTSF
jgi:ATP-dependent DNA ligase